MAIGLREQQSGNRGSGEKIERKAVSYRIKSAFSFSWKRVLGNDVRRKNEKLSGFITGTGVRCSAFRRCGQSLVGFRECYLRDGDWHCGVDGGGNSSDVKQSLSFIEGGFVALAELVALVAQGDFIPMVDVDQSKVL